MSDTKHVLNEPSQPETATRGNKILRKRGRKGNKIALAYSEIPETPVNFEEFAAKYGVTTKVLRQIKRHDRYADMGQVFVRKDKTTKQIMIWREPFDKPVTPPRKKSATTKHKAIKRKTAKK